MSQKEYYLQRQGKEFDKKEQLRRIAEAFEKDNGWPLVPNLLYLAYMGSRSHGTYRPPSDPTSFDDIDFMSVVVPPIDQTIGVNRPWTHWIMQPNTLAGAEELDVTIYSVQKFCGLLLNNNPNVLRLLWLPKDLDLYAHPQWQEWQKQRDIFSSLRAYNSFVQYAKSQLSKMGAPGERAFMGAKRKESFDRLGFDPKNSSHCVRLLRMGIEFVETGILNVDRRNIDAEEILEIKRGKWTLERVRAEADKQFASIEKARLLSPLPENPDKEKAEKLLLNTTLKFWGISEKQIKDLLAAEKDKTTRFELS